MIPTIERAEKYIEKRSRNKHDKARTAVSAAAVRAVLSNNPEWSAGAGSFAGLVKTDGQVPCLLAAGSAGRVSYDVSRLDASTP